MNVDTWNLLINNSTNIIIAGAAVAQVIVVYVTLSSGLTKYNEYLNKQSRVYAQKLYKANKKHNHLLNSIFTNARDYRIDDEQYGYLSKDLDREVNILCGFVHHYDLNRNELKKISSKIHDLLLFLSDTEVRDLYISKTIHLNRIISDYLALEKQLDKISYDISLGNEDNHAGYVTKIQLSFKELPRNLNTTIYSKYSKLQELETKFQKKLNKFILLK